MSVPILELFFFPSFIKIRLHFIAVFLGYKGNVTFGPVDYFRANYFDGCQWVTDEQSEDPKCAFIILT